MHASNYTPQWIYMTSFIPLRLCFVSLKSTTDTFQCNCLSTVFASTLLYFYKVTFPFTFPIFLSISFFIFFYLFFHLPSHLVIFLNILFFCFYSFFFSYYFSFFYSFLLFFAILCIIFVLLSRFCLVPHSHFIFFI